VTSAGRNPNLPNVPPVVETVQSFVEEGWVGMMAPTGTSQVAVDRFSAEIVKLLANPEIRKFYADQGTIAQGSTPAAFGAVIKADIDKWAHVIKVVQVRLD
jgi:tripartite-type tricarboxylate transporter receptor subunit TctC